MKYDQQTSGLEVVPRGNEPVERMIKRFSRMVRDDGVLRDFALRRSYEKPSMKRRRKQARNAAARRIQQQSGS